MACQNGKRGWDGWIDLNIEKNDDNNKKNHCTPVEVQEKNWKGELVGMDDEMGMGEVG